MNRKKKICKFCNQEFTTRQALSKHLKLTCKVKNIDYWKSAPLWTESKINNATKDWFRNLS